MQDKMDWVFCNKCSHKFQSNIRFYLSECGHIFCEKCIEKLKQTKKCVICNKTTSVIELSKDMDYAARIYFWPLEDIVKQSFEVINFQTMHKNLLLQSLNIKYSHAKRECVNYYTAYKKLQKENQLMRDMLKRAGCDPPNPFITSTPANNSSRPAYNNNLSTLSSIRLTPSSRIYQHEKKTWQPFLGAGSISSMHGPSPAQMVPKGFPVPVHREMTPQNPAAATPNFIRLHGNQRYPSGFSRK